MNKTNFILLSFLCLYCNCLAQDFKKDIQTVIGNMMPKEGMASYTMKITYQDNMEKNMIIDSLSGNYKFSGNRYSIVMNGIETCQDDKYMVSLNQQEHILIISEPKELAQLKFNYLSLDSIFIDSAYKITVNRTNEYIIYTIYPFSEAGLDSIVLTIEESRMIFKQVLVCLKKDFKINEGYNPAQYLVMSYDNYKFKKENNEVNNYFDTRKFITPKDKRFVVNKEYENFRVINNVSNLNKTN